MYTAQELIEALQKCPPDYAIRIHADGTCYDLECVGIDHDDNKIDLFGEES